MKRDIRIVYMSMLERLGDDARRVGWDSFDAQTRNFKVVLDSLEHRLKLSDCTLHDAGCGLGALVPALEARGGVKHYIGTDILEPSIIEARTKYPDREFHCLNLETGKLPEADVTVCFGALAFHEPRTIEEMLGRLWASSRKALGFITWWDLPAGYVDHEHVPQLKKCIRRFLGSTQGSVVEHLGTFGTPLEAAFIVFNPKG